LHQIADKSIDSGTNTAVEVYKKRLNNECELEFYDTKGQSLKIMNDTQKRDFVDECHFIFLMYDVTRIETFNNVTKR
jgi:hypothetical protein